MSAAAPPPTGHPLLAGWLQAFALCEVLPWLAHRREEGVLTVSCGPPAGALRRVEIHIRDGVAMGLRATVSPPPDFLRAHPDRLGGVLVSRGTLDVARLRYALASRELLAPARRPRLGRFLEIQGFIAAPDLHIGLAALARRHLATALGWSGGEFVYRPGSLGPPCLPLGERLPRLMLQCAQALDERSGEG